MDDEAIEGFRDLWDRSAPWVLLRSWNDEAVLQVVFAQPRPSLMELRAVRKLFPAYQTIPPLEALRLLGATGELRVEGLSSETAAVLVEQAQALGLEASFQEVSEFQYVPYLPPQEGGPEGGTVLLIEDDQVVRRLCQRMLDEGVPWIDEGMIFSGARPKP